MADLSSILISTSSLDSHSHGPRAAAPREQSFVAHPSAIGYPNNMPQEATKFPSVTDFFALHDTQENGSQDISQNRPLPPQTIGPVSEISNMHHDSFVLPPLKLHSVGSLSAEMQKYVDHHDLPPNQKSVEDSPSQTQKGAEDAASKSKKNGKKKNSPPSSDNIIEIPLEKYDPHTVSHFYHECQKLGITPMFTFMEVEEQKYAIQLQIDSEILTNAGPFKNKKIAKGNICEQGMIILELITTKRAQQEKEKKAALEGNWVGKLQEYVNAKKVSSPSYQFFMVQNTLVFGCEVTFMPDTASPNMTFGNRTPTFSTKKAAKSAAAHAGIKYLISIGEMDGSLIIRKRKHANVIPGAPPKSKFSINDANSEKGNQAQSISIPETISYAARVNELCPLLGLSAPEYRIEQSNELVPTLFSGAAYWTHEPMYTGPYGESEHVRGKKECKETIAKGVLEFLKELAVKRGARIEGSNVIRDHTL